MVKLKSCPFCGNRKMKLARGTVMPLTMVICDKCGATVSFQNKEDMANTVLAWNRRVEAPEKGWQA